MGHQDGVLRAFEADGTLKWSSPAIPGVNTGCNAQTTASAIDSSPAVADLDQDGTAEIIVGVGSTWVSNQNGGDRTSVSGASNGGLRSASTTVASGITPACPTVGAKACSPPLQSAT